MAAQEGERNAAVGGTVSLRTQLERAETLVVQADALTARAVLAVASTSEARDAMRAVQQRSRQMRRAARRNRESLRQSLDLATAHRRYATTHNVALRERLVREYRPNAVALARRFDNRGEPFDDLVQVACAALVAALDRFDPDRGVSFPPYLERSVTGELKRHFRDKVWPLRIPRGLLERYLECRATSERLAGQLGRAVTPGEVAAELGIAEETVLEAMEVGASYRLRSLDAPVFSDGDDARDVPVTDVRFDEVDGAVARAQVLRPLLASLDPQDADLLVAYYVDGKRQQDLAEELGVSQVTVSRRLARVIERLRASARALQ